MKNVQPLVNCCCCSVSPSSSSFLLTCIKTTRNELACLGMGTIFLVIGERSEPLSRVFNDKLRDIYGGVRTCVQNASCYFSKLKLRSPIIVRTYVTLAFLPLKGTLGGGPLVRNVF